MDPLSHTLLGTALARTRLGRSTRLAAPALILGANAPDLDGATYLLATGDVALGFRRGWTHGILAMVVLPLVLWAILLAAERLRRRSRSPDDVPLWHGRLLGLCLLAVLTHPLLDWLNTYGVRFLMPLDGRWFYGDSMFIVDPWLWVLLGGTVVLTRRPGRWGMVGWLLLTALATALIVGAGGSVPGGARVAWLVLVAAVVATRMVVARHLEVQRTATIGVALAVAYIFLMIGAGGLARGRVDEELRRSGLQVERLMVGPLPANPFAWDVVAEAAGSYHHGTFDWLGGPALEMEGIIPRPLPSPVLDAARRAPSVQGALLWMRFPYAEVEETVAGYTVRFLDARYVRARREGFGVSVVRLHRDLRPEGTPD